MRVSFSQLLSPLGALANIQLTEIGCPPPLLSVTQSK